MPCPDRVARTVASTGGTLIIVALLSGCGPSTVAGRDGAVVDLAPDLDLPAVDQASLDLTLLGLPDALLAAPNVVPITVDQGITSLTFLTFNVPFVKIQICAPGSTTNCATIDHVTVDTGSVGLRLLASSLPPAMLAALPAVTDGSSHPLAECYVFADGYVWGSVRSGDLNIGGEHVPSMDFQLIGDPGLPQVPANCASTGAAENTLDSLGSKGLIGLGLYAPDCGPDCESASNFGPGFNYYACPTPTTCGQVTVAQAKQVQNPASLLPTDNNGVLIQLPPIGDAGADSPTGALIFGIGTQSNNAINATTVLPVGDQTTNGSFSVQLGSHTYTYGFIDSGTSDLTFADSALATCKGDYVGWRCPSTPVDLTAQNLDGSAMPHAVSFRVGDASVLLANGNTAYNDVAATTNGDTTLFAWGLPFFFGRSVFTAIQGRSTPAGNGPFFAY